MHGLVNRAIQLFTRDTYGPEVWEEVVQAAPLVTPDFEAMLTYPDSQTGLALETLSFRLDRARDDLMEDIGTYLVSHPNTQSLRRLLRFGGPTFTEFLDSLDELPGRIRMAVSDLVLPELDLRRSAPGHYSLRVTGTMPGWGHLMMGVIRAMADDYGALAMLEHKGRETGGEVIALQVVDTAFAEGRAFDLARAG